MSEEEYCDGCGRGCPLSNPMCQLGMSIARERAQRADGTDAVAGGEGRGLDGVDGGDGYGSGGSRGYREGYGHGRGSHGRSHGGRGYGYGGHRDGRGHGGPHGSGHGHGGSRGGRDPHGGPRGGRTGEGDEFLVRSFHHCAHLLMHRRSKEGGRAGVLMILLNHGFMAQSMLAEKLDIRSASMSELLGKMEQAGLIARRQNESDKRAVWVELTDEGRAEAERVAAQREEDNKNLFAVLTDEEKSQLEVILDKLAHSWHEQFDEKDRLQRDGRGRSS